MLKVTYQACNPVERALVNPMIAGRPIAVPVFAWTAAGCQSYRLRSWSSNPRHKSNQLLHVPDRHALPKKAIIFRETVCVQSCKCGPSYRRIFFENSSFSLHSASDIRVWTWSDPLFCDARKVPFRFPAPMFPDAALDSHATAGPKCNRHWNKSSIQQSLSFAWSSLSNT